MDASYSHMYTDQSTNHRANHGSAGAPPANIFNIPPPQGHRQQSLSSSSAASAKAAAAAQVLFQAFPGSSHAVSIAALHSCRFAHLQGSLLPAGSGLPAPPSGPGQSNYLSAAYYFAPMVPPTSAAVVLPVGVADPTPPAHVHCMFLARVLVGDYATGRNSYRKPPPVDASKPFGRCFDSCVNDMNNPTIFVVFNSAQCYPEYIIEYTNKPRDAI